MGSKESMNIMVISIDGTRQEISTTYETTCGQLKDKITTIWGLLPSEQILRFGTAELSNPNEKLMTYGIKNGSSIILTLKLSQFKVVVGSPCGKSIKILVNLHNTVKSLKDEIQKQLSVLVEEQTLMFREEILENNKKLSEYGIDKECFISLIPKNEIQVILQTGNSRYIAIKINVKKCISDLKSKILQKLEMKEAFPTLIYQGELLHDNKTIDHYGIDANSVIIVHWITNKAMDRIKLFAKFIDGQVFVIYVSKNAKIYDIKINIHEKLQIHPDDQKLIYQGAFLRDNESLVDYQIGENSVLQVMPRMRF